MKMNAINWPEGFVPGFTDNYCSNEMIVAGLTAKEVWPLLNTPGLWPVYYKNSDNVRFYNNKGPELEQGVNFSFETFGFPVDAQVTEYVAPSPDAPARLSWHGRVGEKGTEKRLDVHHGWLIEDLSDHRVRILTQETQNGAPAIELAKTDPNPMINGHQAWLDGLVAAAKARQNTAQSWHFC